MIKRLLTLFIIMVMLLCQAPLSFIAEAGSNNAIFYNAETNGRIMSLNNEKAIYSKVNFVAKSDKAAVVVAQYDTNNKFLCVSIEKLNNLTTGKMVYHTTKKIDIECAEKVMLFVFDGETSIIPLVGSAVVLKKGTGFGGGGENQTPQIPF